MPRGQYSGPGYWVMTPLALDSGGTVFVNRGFVPQDLGRRLRRRRRRRAGPRDRSPASPASPRRHRRLHPGRRSANAHRLGARSRAACARWPARTSRRSRRIYVDLPAGDPGALPQGGETSGRIPQQPPRLCADLVRLRPADPDPAGLLDLRGSAAGKGAMKLALHRPVSLGCAAIQSMGGHPPNAVCLDARPAPVLGFSDAVLAGLARDGGLYLPETWPQIDAAEIAGFATGPMPTSPCHHLRASSAARFADADAPRIIDEAYATFRHPSVTPLVEIEPGHFLLELFHGPTLAFKDVAMQFLARLMDHILAERGSARHHRRRHLRRHRLGRHRGVPRPRQHRHLHPAPRGPHLRGAAPADDDGARRQRPQHRARGHVRRLPEHRQGPVQQPRASATSVKLSRRQLHQLGPHRRADRLLLHRRGLARRAASRGLLRRPHRQFRRHLRRLLPPSAWACRSRRWSSPPTATTSCARTLETGRYEIGAVTPTISPSMDIQVSSNFERLLFEALGRDARRAAAPDGRPRPVGRFTVPDQALAAIRADFRRRPRPTRPRPSATIARRSSRVGLSARSAHRRRRRCRRARCSAATRPMVTLATAHPAKFPAAVKAATGIEPPCRYGWLIFTNGRSASTCWPTIRVRSKPSSGRAAARHGSLERRGRCWRIV